MIKLKLPNGALVYVKEGVWHADDPLIGEILTNHAHVAPGPSVGDVDRVMAQMAIDSDVIRAEFVEEVDPPKFVKGRVY